MARLQERYVKEIRPEIMKLYALDNTLAAPRLDKIVVSMGIGLTPDSKERMAAAVDDLATVTGQRPATTLARKSVSGFKLRQGMPIGQKVTLRGKRMYEFLDRLISIAVPRIRDFRGLPAEGFDGSGNYNMGLAEQTVFPEIAADKVQFTQGMNIAIVIVNSDDEKSFELLKAFGMPFTRPTSESH
jgi:large subunit ribosomal protein L5